MEWITLTLQVTTPLFNGSADPDDTGGFRAENEPGVRVASIRGAMRFWFRALAGTLAGPDVRLLSSLERRVFGGIADQRSGGEAATASPLILRLPDPPKPSRDASFLERPEGTWISYLLGLGLMRPGQGGASLLRSCVAPGGKPFELKIGFRHDRRATADVQQAIEALALASLWLTCAYGGLGARVRRGFGGVRIVAASGDLPSPWTPRGYSRPASSFTGAPIGCGPGPPRSASSNSICGCSLPRSEVQLDHPTSGSSHRTIRC